MVAADDQGSGPSPTVGAAVREATRRLRDAGLDSPVLDARLLVAACLGLDHDRLISHADEAMPRPQADRLAAMLERRLAREPVSRILGRREFWGRDFLLSAATLDPRPETETVVEAALTILRCELSDRPAPRLLDIGTGTGCILLTLLAELPGATGLATDVSAEALATARTNAGRLGVQDRLEVRQTSMLDGIEGPFDLLISNPPYIPSGEIAVLAPEVTEHDPVLALDGGPDGLAFYRRIIAEAKRVVPAGWVVLETGHDQADAVVLAAEAAGTVAAGTLRTYLDLSGRSRCVVFSTHV